MPAYMLAVCDITNMTDNMKKYAELSAKLIKENDGKYLIRGAALEEVQGDKLQGSIIIVTEFPTMDQLKAFWEGDEYNNNVKHLRDGTGTYHIAIYESPPPTMQ